MKKDNSLSAAGRFLASVFKGTTPVLTLLVGVVFILCVVEIDATDVLKLSSGQHIIISSLFGKLHIFSGGLFALKS